MEETNVRSKFAHSTHKAIPFINVNLREFFSSSFSFVMLNGFLVAFFFFVVVCVSLLFFEIKLQVAFVYVYRQQKPLFVFESMFQIKTWNEPLTHQRNTTTIHWYSFSFIWFNRIIIMQISLFSIYLSLGTKQTAHCPFSHTTINAVDTKLFSHFSFSRAHNVFLEQFLQ